MMQAFPELPFWFGSRLVMLTIPSIIISMLFYTRLLYKDETPQGLFYVLLSLNALYAFMVLAFSSTVYTEAFIPYMLAVGASCVFGCYVAVRAIRRREKESVFFLAGMLLLVLGALIDALVYTSFLHVRYMLSDALLGFIVIQAILLAKRYSDAFRRTKLLSADLQASLDTVMKTETAYMARR